MKWFINRLFDNELVMFFVFVFALVVTLGVGVVYAVGGMIERDSHNSCVVDVVKAGKSVEDAKGLCK